jgi:hypothetical protein
MEANPLFVLATVITPTEWRRHISGTTRDEALINELTNNVRCFGGD